MGYQNFHCTFCEERLYNTFSYQVYGIFILRFGGQILWLVLAMLEIMLNYERYCVLYNAKSSIVKVPIKVLTLLFFILHILLMIPDFLSLRIEYSPDIEKYTYTYTEFGKTSFYNIYLVIYIGVTYLITFLSLLIFNIINLKKYRFYVSYRKRSHLNKKMISKEERTFTLMIIITTTSFITIMIINIISIALTRIYFVNGVYYLSYVNIIRAISLLLGPVHYALDPFIYLAMDLRLRKYLLFDE